MSRLWEWEGWFVNHLPASVTDIALQKEEQSVKNLE